MEFSSSMLSRVFVFCSIENFPFFPAFRMVLKRFSLVSLLRKISIISSESVFIVNF